MRRRKSSSRDALQAITATLACAALVGCGSGCDGERGGAHTQSPRPPVPERVLDAAPLAPADADHIDLPPTLSFLDAAPGTLDTLFGGLAAAERGEVGTGRTLILVFGDSHTAGDSMTSRLRVSWQKRFGDAGRGLVAAGRPPTKHYYQRDVHYGTTGTWRAAVGGHHGDVEPFGIDGLRVSGQSKGAQLWVETCADCQAGSAVGQFELLYYAAPDHGLLRYRVDDQAWQQLATKTSAIEPPHPARAVIPVPDGRHKLTLEHGGGGAIDLFGVVLERVRPGVIVDSLGVVGRRLGSLRSWDWSIIGDQLATRDPKLVILQYGTNEADDPDLDLDAVAKYYDETILRVRAAAPTASIVILGPPDLGVREGGRACDHGKPSKLDAGVTPECEWRTPGVLGEIIAMQHAAALRNHVAFFDTFAAMGGADHMHEWVIAEPKVAFKDHVHFTDIGYQRWADALSGALLERYGEWRRTNHLPDEQPISLPPPVAPNDAPLPGPIPP